MSKLKFEQESYKIRGSAFEVYKEMGNGFLEPVYQECLEREFGIQSIPFKAQERLSLCYKGIPLEKSYEPDFCCFEKIIVEIKAVRHLLPEHRAQVHNYLKATRLELGILVNFGHYPGVEIERIVL